MMNRTALACVLLVMCWTGWALVKGETKSVSQIDEDQESALMLAKLASSQKIVTGLVSKDFAEIARGADELVRISHATEWNAHKDPVYAHYRRELVQQAEKVSQAAKQRNLDGSTYAYMHALTTCISCHEYCRDVLKIAESEPELQVVPIPVTENEKETAPKSRIRR